MKLILIITRVLPVTFTTAVLVMASQPSVAYYGDQNVVVNTLPQGAQCTLVRYGETIATVERTPASLDIERDEDDIRITCRLEGYMTGHYLLESDIYIHTQMVTIGREPHDATSYPDIDLNLDEFDTYEDYVIIILQRLQ